MRSPFSLLRHLWLAVMFAAAVVTLSGCSYVNTEPGTVSVLFDKPRFVGKGGIREDDIRVEGKTFTWLTTDSLSVPITPMVKQENFNDLMTGGTGPVDFATGVQIRVTDPVGWVRCGQAECYTRNMQRQYQALMVQEVRKYTMNELLTTSAPIAAIERNIRLELDKLVKEKKLPFEVTDLTLGRAMPNKPVMDQLDASAAQQQRARTMENAAKAEEARAVAEGKRAAADNAYRLNMNLSAEQFVRLEEVKRFAAACEKGGCIVNVGGGGNAAVMMAAKK